VSHHLPPTRWFGPSLIGALAVVLLAVGCATEGASAGGPDATAAPSAAGAASTPTSPPMTLDPAPDGASPDTDPAELEGPTDGAGTSGSDGASPPQQMPDPTLPLLPTTTTTFIDRSVDPPAPVADPGGPPGRNSVMVVGDSVLMGAASALPLVTSHWLVTFDAVESRRLAQAIDLFADRRHEVGEAVVICLGSNYIPGERGSYASQIDEVMSLLWFVPRVVWVTVPEVNPGRDEINRSIREAASRWPNMRVADWAPIVAAEPDLAWDGMHLTVEGRRAIAQLVAQTLGPVDER
jgi:hypothetical protein